jgi:EmrB/QacA subfamily drug resistance transporter
LRVGDRRYRQKLLEAFTGNEAPCAQPHAVSRDDAPYERAIGRRQDPRAQRPIQNGTHFASILRAIGSDCNDGKPAGVKVPWVLIAAILGSTMTFIDSTAVNVSLPVIQRELHATTGQTQWVIEGYALFLSALILSGGALGDLYGRKRVFAIGIALFAVASLACAFAGNMSLLIAARCVQGIGGALSTPGSLSLLSSAYDSQSRGRAIGLWSGFSSLTSAAGPIIGGWLTQNFSWRYVFVINVPVAIAVLIVLALHVPESRDESADRKVDIVGATLATLGLGLLVFGLIEMNAGRVSAPALVSTIAGIGVLIAFVLFERRTPDPMVRCDLFASRAFSVANVYTFLLYAAIGGSLYFVPFVLINVHHYTPTAAGAALLPFIFIMVVSSRWSGGLVARIGPRTPLLFGSILAGLGFLAYALPGTDGSYWTTFFPAATILGLGGALFVAPLTTTVMNSVPVEHAGLASGVNNAVARTAGLIGVAVLGIIVTAAPSYVLGFRGAMVASALLSFAAGAIAAWGFAVFRPPGMNAEIARSG